MATEAKGALTAYRSGDVARSAAFLFRGRVWEMRGLLILLYVIYRTGLTGSMKERLEDVMGWPNPFLKLKGKAYNVGHALRGSYLHFPIKTLADGVTRVCRKLLELKQFRRLERMEQVGTLVFLIYMRSLRLARFFWQKLKKGSARYFA